MISLRSPESFVPEGHPIRRIKVLVDGILKEMSPEFDAIYADRGRRSVPPEWLLKTSLLMALYSVRSERLFCEQLGYNLLFRWFLDMDMESEPFDHSTLSRNRERLMAHELSGRFFALVVEAARRGKLMSSEHFTVDGTLIEAWASVKSFVPKDEADSKDDDEGPRGGDAARRRARNMRKSARQARARKSKKTSRRAERNANVDFRGQKRSNETHRSTTDPEALLARKGRGKEAKLCYSAHALMENRNGLLVKLDVASATGTAEREVALEMLSTVARPGQRKTLGADKGYDTKDFVASCREMNVTPHVATNESAHRSSAIDARVTSKPGYGVSQRIRKRVEEIFGWAKTVGGFRRTRFKGLRKTRDAAYIVGAAYNLVRMSRLLTAPA